MTGNLCLAVDLTERANGSPLFLNLVLTPLTCICLLSVCLSVHLLNQPLIPPPIHPPLLTDPSALPFTHPSIHSCICLSLHSPIYLLIYPFSFLSICPSTPVTGIIAWVPLVCKPLPPPFRAFCLRSLCGYTGRGLVYVTWPRGASCPWPLFYSSHYL